MPNIQRTSCDDDLRQLLASWKLENIFSHLIAENINMEILEMIKLSHIKAILHKFPLGIQIRFEHNLERWRYKIGKPLKYHGYNGRCNQTLNVDYCSNHGSPLTTKNSRETDFSSTLVDLREILSQCTPQGPELLAIYRKNSAFTDSERNCLIKIIVNFYLKNDRPFNLHLSYDLENAIMSLFPNEKLHMYRTGELGIIYEKYLLAKTEYGKECFESTRNEDREDLKMEIEENRSLLMTYDSYAEDGTVVNTPTEFFLQTLYNGRKKFIKVFEPYLYQDFFVAACTTFDVVRKQDLYVAVNDCEISYADFKNIVLQYYKLPTFYIELKERAITEAEDYEYSLSAPTTFTPSNNTLNNCFVQVNSNYLPDANDIRNIPGLMHIVKMYDNGKMLENKHRCTIAKAIIDECLNLQPERVLKSEDFITLTQSLIRAFPTEVESTYFIRYKDKRHACGKLLNAYNNKRRLFVNSGVVERPHPHNEKRKHESHGKSDETSNKSFITNYSLEYKDFAINSILDWDTIKQKWSDTHEERRKELLQKHLEPGDYLKKYSILKSNRGIELMEIDVNILHPTVDTINNWLTFYHRIVERARTLRKMPMILEKIDSSNDEKYRASLALLIIPSIFPYNPKRNEISNERMTKSDIQNRFIKEYATLDELNSDIECSDLQIRIVHSDHHITYAEFKICDQIFRSVDLLQALSSTFHYMLGLNLEYPRICRHIWQFVQLVIFQIEIQNVIEPNVESIYSDLCIS